MWVLENCSSRFDLLHRSHILDERYVLYCGKWTIGRGSTSSIRVAVHTVSRQHICLVVDNQYDALDPSSIMEVTITDVSTKHNSKWNGKPLNVLVLSKKEEQGTIMLTNSCSFQIRWEPHVMCFSRVPSSQRKILQAKLKQLGFHYLQTYVSKQVQYLVVHENFDVTPKLLQALVECVYVVTPKFIEELVSSQASLCLPDFRSFSPKQNDSQITVLPQPFRQTVLHSYTFHFCPADSPYRDIVPLAGGRVDASTSVSRVSSGNDVVVFQTSQNASSSPRDTQTLVMTRSIPQEAMEWVKSGWIPLEEQELMRCLLFSGEMGSMMSLGRERQQQEAKMMLESKTESQNKELPPLPLTLKRPDPIQSVDEVDDFFNELDAASQTPQQSVFVSASKKRQIQPVGKGSSESAELNKPIKEEGMDGESPETPHQASDQQTSLSVGSLQEMGKLSQSSSSSPGKGKRFVKCTVKKSWKVVPLYPYHPWCVC